MDPARSGRSTFVSEIQRLLTGERADPREAQAVFLVPVAVEMVLRMFSDTPVDRYFAYGCLVAVVPTLGALAIGTGRASTRWTIWLPVLDIAALSLFRLSPGSALGVAVGFPAIWLGLQFGRKGVVVTAVMMLLAYVIPTLILMGPNVASFSRITQTIMMAVIASAAVAATAEMWKAKSVEATASARRLQRAMQDVVDQRRFVQSIFDSVDVGLVALDARGAYDSVNPRHEEFLTLAYPDGHRGWAGQTGHVYAADGTTPMERDDMPTMKAGRGEAFSDYLIWVGPDPAQRRALAVSSTPHFTEDGTFTGAVLAYHDITDLVTAVRIKDEFVASVSHELRTPLTSIIGYVDVLLDDVDEVPEGVRFHLATVQRNAKRLHRLVDDLLSSALQSVAAILEMRELSVSRLLHLSAREAAKSADAAGLTFEVTDETGGDDLGMAGDPERLAQVFDNLFSNAVKYTPSGGHVAGGLRKEGDEAVVWVRDNGRGIAAAEIGEVFTKFFRSASAQHDAIPGVGLGLAITKTIVDAHGGSITVVSEVGRGSTFEVRLPLSEASLVRAESGAA